MADDPLTVTPSLSIPADELVWRFTGSGGPGGQHANTSNTRVEVAFDAAASPSLDSWQRARIVGRLGPVVRVVAADERSQLRNRTLASSRLAERLASALVVERSRRPTRPTKASKERRLAAKRHQSDRKQSRRGHSADPD